MKKSKVKSTQATQPTDEAEALVKKCRQVRRKRRKLKKQKKTIPDSEILNLVEASRKIGLRPLRKNLYARLVAASVIYRHFAGRSGPLPESLSECCRKHGLADTLSKKKLHLHVTRLCIESGNIKYDSKYAAVVRMAWKRKFGPLTLFKQLNEQGGLSEFLKSE